MPLYKIADVPVEMSPRFEDTASWYEPYLCKEDIEPQISITATDEEIDYFLTKGEGFTHGTAENTVLTDKFNRRLLKFGGSYIHSSALLFDDKVYLISGSSGVGKSTLTARWCRMYPDRTEVINDDKPSFRLMDDKCIIYGTPFAGGTCKQLNKSAELGAIVFLEQAATDTLRKLPTPEAISLLLEQTPGRLTPKIADKLLSMYSDILTHYPVYKLSCTESDNAVTTAMNIIKQI